jgi:hypothetical protein
VTRCPNYLVPVTYRLKVRRGFRRSTAMTFVVPTDDLTFVVAEAIDFDARDILVSCGGTYIRPLLRLPSIRCGPQSCTRGLLLITGVPHGGCCLHTRFAALQWVVVCSDHVLEHVLGHVRGHVRDHVLGPRCIAGAPLRALYGLPTGMIAP